MARLRRDAPLAQFGGKPMIEYTYLDTPLARFLALSDGEALTGLYFADQPHAPSPGADWVHRPDAALFARLATQLREFAEGKRREFALPLRPSGTDFQKAVWEVIQTVPFGSTISYSELASRAGKPDAIRAAGTATGRNPISWLVPCHRVVGKGGSMTGYAGGLSRKVALLDFEAGKKAALTRQLKP